MNDDEMLDDFIERHLASLEGAAPAPDPDALPEHLQDVAAEQAAVLSAAWGTAAKIDLASDPLAQRLGLDRSENRYVDGRAVGNARKQAGLVQSELIIAVQTAGGDLDQRSLFQLERSESFQVSAMTAIALGAALGADVSSFTVDSAPSMLDDAVIAELIDSWAAEMGRPRAEVTAAVERELAGASFRSEGLEVEHLREMVAAILRSMK